MMTLRRALLRKHHLFIWCYHLGGIWMSPCLQGSVTCHILGYRGSAFRVWVRTEWNPAPWHTPIILQEAFLKGKKASTILGCGEIELWRSQTKKTLTPPYIHNRGLVFCVWVLRVTHSYTHSNPGQINRTYLLEIRLDILHSFFSTLILWFAPWSQTKSMEKPVTNVKSHSGWLIR